MKHQNGNGRVDSMPIWAPSAAGPSSAPDSPYWVPVSDEKGHSIPVQVSIYPGDMRAIEALVGPKESPFQRPADFIRYAIHKTLLDWDGDAAFEAVITVSESLASVLRQNAYTQSYEVIFRSLHEQYERHVSDGQEAMAKDLLLATRERFERMHDTVWKELYLRKFDGEFGALL